MPIHDVSDVRLYVKVESGGATGDAMRSMGFTPVGDRWVHECGLQIAKSGADEYVLIAAGVKPSPTGRK